MTLWTQIDSNKRKTWVLMTTFLILFVLLGWLFSYIFKSRWILIIAVMIATTQAFLSYWYSDKIILKTMRAKEISKKDAPELYRIVENLSITAGLPMPKVYIIEERQPNAFATGRDPHHSAIVVTRGLLDLLEDEELEGVIAHEMAHIGNRDILLQTVLVILVGAIALLSDFFLRMSFWGFRREEDSRGNILLFLMAILAAVLAPLVATIIQLAISRKREFLADATGALLTRYPEGLARALEKISKVKVPLKGANISNAHLFIENPLRGSKKYSFFERLFMTHPPVEERIKALREMNI